MAEHEKMIICLVIVAVHCLFLCLITFAIAETCHCIEMELMKIATKIEILKWRARDKYGN